MLSRHFQIKKPKSSSDQNEIGNLAKYGIKVTDANFDYALRQNQKKWYGKYTDTLKYLMTKDFGIHEYKYDPIEAASLLSEMEHMKKKLRQAAMSGLWTSGDFIHDAWTKALEWKLKFIEIAKPGKDPRVIVDCKVENSLPRVHFANSWKNHTADKTLKLKDVECHFCSSPSPQQLRDVFDRAWSYTKPIGIFNFSDDAIIVMNFGGKRHVYLVDISSNDSSHSEVTFNCYAECSNMDDLQRKNLFAVLRSNFTVRSECGKYYAMFKPNKNDMYLPSGIGDTTVSNNMVYMMLAVAFQEHLDAGKEVCLELLTYAGFHMGFRFSYVEVEAFEKMQFLKNSPIRVNGKTVSVPNLGIMMRYSGTLERELPGGLKYPEYVKTIADKYRYFQSLLTYGFFKFYRYQPLQQYLCPFFDKIHKDQPTADIKKYSHKLYDIETDREPVYLTTEQFYARYDVSTLDILEFENLVSDLDVGKMLWCKLVDIVLEADYGLKW